MFEVDPKVVKEVGWIPALFLSQLSTWETERGVTEEGKIWVTATHDEWAETLGCCRRSFSRAKDQLQKAGLVVTAHRGKSLNDRTLSYARTEKEVPNATV